MKTKQKGVSTAAMTMAVVVVAVVVVAGAAVYLLGGPKIQPTGGIAMNASATVKLHDAEVIDLAVWTENFMPDIPGLTISISGTATVNSFSASNVTVKLHNKTTDQWITIVDGQTITDMTVANDLVKEISAGTYDKVSVYIGTITIDVTVSDIVVSGYVDPTYFGAPAGTPTVNIGMTVPGDNYTGSFGINKEFVLNFLSEVEVTEGENQVFDADTNSPFNPSPTYSFASGFDFDLGAGELNSAKMVATGL